MTINVTITKPGVTDQYGRAMVVGTTYAVDDNFGLSLIQQLKATDTNSALSPPGFNDAEPMYLQFVNQAAITNPTRQMLNSYNITYAQNTSPYTEAYSVGDRLVSIATTVRPLSTDNTAAAATANTASIQAALTAGGLVQITTPGTYYVNDSFVASGLSANVQLGFGVVLLTTSGAPVTTLQRIQQLPVAKSGPKIAILGNSIVDLAAAPRTGTTGTSWDAGATYATSAVASPSFNDLSGGIRHIKWVATTGGVTGATEPNWKWSDPVGTTYTDGTVTWTAQAETAGPIVWLWGFWSMAQALSGQLLDEVVICGRSGKQSDNILSYLDRALATNPDVVAFFAMFDNDCWPGAAPTLSTIATRWNSFVTAADRVRGMGKRVMVSTNFPSGSIDSASAFTTYVAGDGTKAWMWLNQKIREYARARPDVILWDVSQVYIDPNPANPVYPNNSTTFTSATGSGQQLKFTDTIHPYSNAGWALAKTLAPILTANFPARTIFNPSGDTWQLGVNPLGFGTGGTKTTITTGTTPNNMNATGQNGTAAASSVSSVARTDISGNWCAVVGVAAAATQGDAIQYGNITGFNLGAFAVGDVAQAFVEQKIAANPTGFVRPEFQWYSFGSTPNFMAASAVYTPTVQDEGASFTTETTLTLKSPPIILPTGAGNMFLYNRADWRGSANITASFGRNAVKFVTQKTTPV
jgi:hypothetical protein